VDVIVVAWLTSGGWEWNVFPDCEHGLSDSQNFADEHEGARIFTIDVFDAVAYEIERACPWVEEVS
jgi:hypothetical protein